MFRVSAGIAVVAPLLTSVCPQWGHLWASQNEHSSSFFPAFRLTFPEESHFDASASHRYCDPQFAMAITRLPIRMYSLVGAIPVAVMFTASLGLPGVRLTEAAEGPDGKL
jgi:hypothetical protein